MAAPAFTRPSMELRVEANGRVCPQGNMVKKPTLTFGTTVALIEYACAVAGIPQELSGIVKPRAFPPLKNGPPNGPLGLRVSATRHGVTAMKRRATGFPTETLTESEGIPLATTSSVLEPVSISEGTSNWVETGVDPVATAIVLW